jgi:hypothetical protein
MGLDLSLMPITHDTPQWGLGHQILELDRNYDIFDAIGKLPTTPVPDRFDTYKSRGDDGESCYGNTQITPYGQKLMATTMGELKKAGVTGPAGAFIKASPDNQRVALFWH